MSRALLGENLPRKLKWAALEFDALLTMDRGMEHQQNLSGLDLCLIVLSAVSNDIDDLLPLVPLIDEAVEAASPGVVIRVGA